MNGSAAEATAEATAETALDIMGGLSAGVEINPDEGRRRTRK